MAKFTLWADLHEDSSEFMGKVADLLADRCITIMLTDINDDSLGVVCPDCQTEPFPEHNSVEWCGFCEPKD